MCRCRVAAGFSALAGLGTLGAISLSPADIAGYAVALLFSLSWHECAHAWTAYRFGDPTAKLLGRVTLNPIPHIDLIGTIVLPVLSLLGNSPIGLAWAKPTPVNPFNLRSAVAPVLIAIAGPVSNLILFFLFAGATRLFFDAGMTLENAGVKMVFGFVTLNAVLAVLNLLPVPPLDGSKVVAGFLSPKAQEAYLRLDFAGFFILLILSASGMLGRIIGPPIQALMDVAWAIMGVSRG